MSEQEVILDKFNPDAMEFINNSNKGEDAGEYTVEIALTNGCKWIDGTTENIELTWKIVDSLKAQLAWIGINANVSSSNKFDYVEKNVNGYTLRNVNVSKEDFEAIIAQLDSINIFDEFINKESECDVLESCTIFDRTFLIKATNNGDTITINSIEVTFEDGKTQNIEKTTYNTKNVIDSMLSNGYFEYTEVSYDEDMETVTKNVHDNGVYLNQIDMYMEMPERTLVGQSIQIFDDNNQKAYFVKGEYNADTEGMEYVAYVESYQSVKTTLRSIDINLLETKFQGVYMLFDYLISGSNLFNTNEQYKEALVGVGTYTTEDGVYQVEAYGYDGSACMRYYFKDNKIFIESNGELIEIVTQRNDLNLSDLMSTIERYQTVTETEIKKIMHTMTGECSGTFEYDETNHWFTCDKCVEHVESHEWDENSEYCKICGYNAFYKSVGESEEYFRNIPELPEDLPIIVINGGSTEGLFGVTNGEETYYFTSSGRAQAFIDENVGFELIED